ncbi:MAG: hypothetical protein GXP42_06150 [Chloroflexi bacterium]|nr:hypothetical protein [Chloroflexota bacterium]
MIIRARRDAVHLLPPLLVAFGLRLFRLGDANIWWDEGLAVWAARMSIADMARWTATDVHPPLYFALLHFWRMAAGDEEFAVRFLSAALGTLTVAALWRLGRALFPHRPSVALIAAWLLALSRFAIWWSQEVRMYALGGLLFTLSLYFTARLRWRPDTRARVGYLLSTIAALWTLYLLAFTLIIEGLYWLWTLRKLPQKERLSRLGEWALYQIIVLAAFLPWLFYALPRMRTWSVQTPFAPKVYAELYAVLLTVGQSTRIERSLAVVGITMAVIALGLVIGFWRGRGRSQSAGGARDGVWLLLLALLIPPAVVWFATTVPRSFGYSPKPEARYLLPFAPPFYLLTGWALAALTLGLRRRVRLFFTLMLVAAAFLVQAQALRGYYAQRYLKDDYPSLTATLAAHIQPDDAVFLHTDQPWPVFAYHWPREFAGWPNGQDADPGSVNHWLEPIWNAHEAVWLVVNEDALRADPQLLVEDWLGQRASGRQEWRFGPKRLVLFARTPTRAANLLALAADFAPPRPAQSLQTNDWLIAGWEQALTRVKAGDLAHVALTIRRDANAAVEDLVIALGDPPLAQTSLALPPGPELVRVPITLAVPPDASPGRHPWTARAGTEKAVLGWVDVIPAAAPPATPSDLRPQHPISATFGDPPLAQLLGYDLSGDPIPGGEITLTLYWRVQNPTTISYKVFSHLIGADGRPAAQGDDFPLAGERPTTTWRAGEILADAYAIRIPENVPPGAYPLRIGFYDPVTGARLSPVLDDSAAIQAHDQLELGVVELRKP